ncbi:Aerobic respiration control sensor protein ArcB [compost metagenome]
MVADTGRGKVYLLYDATDNEERVHDFGLIVLGVGAICVLGAYALSRRVAAVAVGPLLDLTDRLATWAPGAPDLAVIRDDEAGRLIEAFNRVQNQVDRSIAREREFAGNLSHEIRTPLAAIRSDSELMLLTQSLTPDQHQRLTRVVDNVDDVIVCLESARAMARDQLLPPAPVDIGVCMDDAWRGYEAQAGQADLRFDNQIGPGHVLTLDRYALLTVLRNLVRNAVEHAAPATLTVKFHAPGVLELRDDGKGIAADDLPFLFRRYYSGRMRDSGAAEQHEAARGLGLAIAKRVCDMQGWLLTVESSQEPASRGTRFLLRFDAYSVAAEPNGATRI